MAVPAVILLFARDPRRGEIVVAASDAAATAGVRLGMPLVEAAALADRMRQPHKPIASLSILIEPHDPSADWEALSGLAEHCERFSPIVGWETVHSPKFQVPSFKWKQSAWNLEPGTWNFLGPSFLFLDVTGIGVLFGGDANLAREVVAGLAQLGYQAQIAIADTIGAAWGAARQSSKFEVQSSKLFEQDVLSWNLDALRLPRETIDLLGQLGLTQVGQVLALPRDSLRARFGEHLLLRIDQALGTAQEKIVAHRAPPRFSEEQVLEYPQERPEVVAHIVRQLVQRIARELAARREGVVRLAVRLDCVGGRPLVLEVGLFRPSADEAHLWDLVRMQLDQHPLPGAAGRIRIDAILTARLENRQGLLFTGDEHEAARQLALFIDRCTSRLGAASVLRPELTADPLPEKAVRYRARAGRGFRVRGSGFRRQGTGDRRQGNREVPEPHWRPIMVCSPPVPLSAVSLAPDGPPLSFELDGQRQQVIYHEGPERIEAGWWRGTSVRRDYWRVETSGGQRYWLFRDLGSGQWHLHGCYA
jgi:protein ImuB